MSYLLVRMPPPLAVTSETGVATGSQIQKNGIDGFAVQTTGSATINNANALEGFICAGDWVAWQFPQYAAGRPRFTVVGLPPAKALAEIRSISAVDLVAQSFPQSGASYINKNGSFLTYVQHTVIGRALTGATQCQEFDIML